ncbi:MAG: hypothetical protein KDJ47_08475 [Hyphomicrobiaceae bacterium]|nr:hypothetical protein [Hyphomicrobiaceae bacterium]
MSTIRVTAIRRSHRAEFIELFKQMHETRKQQFVDRLSWPLGVRFGYELDRYDSRLGGAWYILCTFQGADKIAGSMRLLSTSGFHLFEMFPALRDVSAIDSNAFTWEASRMCISVSLSDRRVGLGSIAGVSAGLLLGMNEFGLQRDAHRFVGVYYEPMLRIYRRIGWEPRELGRVTGNNGEDLISGEWSVSCTNRDTIRRRMSDFDFEIDLPFPG